MDINISQKSYPLIQKYKKIHDSIHGYISISNYACRIINSKYFQHLRYKKQLGTVFYVFPNAVHTRFEHSIGTYYYATRIMECILFRTKQEHIMEYLSKIPYLQNYYKRQYNGASKLDDYICELVKIAALCHDIGHGPFSHMFDDIFLPLMYKNKDIDNITHEERSSKLIEKIIKTDDILKDIITDDEIEFIKHVINPTNDDIGFLFQIVSNTLNGLDVDKYDYLIRDSTVLGLKVSFDASRLVDDIIVVDNNICYPEQIILDIYNMFNTRYILHKQIYLHKSTISTQILISEYMKLVDSELKISEIIKDLDKFILFGDNTMFDFLNLRKALNTSNNKETYEIQQAYKLLDRLNNHDTYHFVDSILSDHKLNEITNDILPNCNEKTYGLLKDELVIFNTKIGLVSGDKSNPLKSIYSYSTKSLLNGTKPIVKKIDMKDVSLLIPSIHQENIAMFYIKNKHNIDAIEETKKIITKIKQLEK